VAQNERKKPPIYIFSTFGSKINEFEWKKLEKILILYTPFENSTTRIAITPMPLEIELTPHG
jgi:hypothetical protein